MDNNISAELSDNICLPISSLSDAWTYLEKVPKWVDNIKEIVPRSCFVVKNTINDCHVNFEKFGPRTRLDRRCVPRTLVCHDMKGGYLEDRFIGAINIGNCYSFYRWAQIDIFVYFSHHLITIPPISWINIAHNNGVKILGTFITEFDVGEKICQEIFVNETKMRGFVNVLVGICVTFKLDGWLLNIENKLTDVTLLKHFVDLLTKTLHFRKPGSLVIWYDSVTCDGELRWQNALNKSNKCYFDSCDGIFLNYGWNEASLLRTVEVAQHRTLDVFVGIDVFGRNCFGGGCFNTYLAAQKVREYNLSIAIFAQGWTHETLPKEPLESLNERFLIRDNAFWRSLWPYLYTHPITKPFQSFFYTGVDKHWCKLHMQDIQLSRILHARDKTDEELAVATLKEACDCLQLHIEDNFFNCLVTKTNLTHQRKYIHRLFLCEIPINGQITFYYYLKSPEDFLSIILLVNYSNGPFKQIICNSFYNEELRNDSSVLELNPIQDKNILNQVSQMNTSVPSTWVLRCYSLQLYDARILEMGARIDENVSLCLCGVGFVEI